METMRIRLRQALNDGEKFTVKDFCAVLLVLALMVLLAVFMPNNDVQSLLERRGYDTTGIAFTRVDTGFGRHVYASSVPLPLNDGEYCDLWEIVDYGNSSFLTYVYPYPSGTWNAEITQDVTITFTEQEYKEIKQNLDGLTVEEYIKNRALISEE